MTSKFIPQKQSDFKDLIDRLKIPGYLDIFTPYFKGKGRLPTLPGMLRRRLGLHDGKKWTYKQIAEVTCAVSPSPVSSPILGTKLSKERVRQCLNHAYRIIKSLENSVK